MSSKWINTSRPAGKGGCTERAPQGESERAGELRCLLKPRFFCGQLLADRDLNAMLQWVEDKHALQRLRLGWGIVCGLQVACHETKPSFVKIRPGYAVDASGRDIVVCEETTFDLAKACLQASQRCTRFARSDQPEEVITGLCDLPLLEGERVVVDLMVHYDDSKKEEPLPALTRRTCGQEMGCDYSRIREGHRFSWVYTDPCKDPVEEALIKWKEGYLGLATTFLNEKFPEQVFHRDTVKKCLQKRIEESPLYEFCFVSDLVQRLDQDSQHLDAMASKILTLIILDARNEYLSKPCPITPPDCGGVPLARVWLQQKAGAPAPCKVARIDNLTPVRNVSLQERWPAPVGMYNAGQLIWRWEEEAWEALGKLGIAVEVEEIQCPETLEDVKNLFNENLRSEMLLIELTHDKPSTVRIKTVLDQHCQEGRERKQLRVVSICSMQDV